MTILLRIFGQIILLITIGLLLLAGSFLTLTQSTTQEPTRQSEVDQNKASDNVIPSKSINLQNGDVSNPLTDGFIYAIPKNNGDVDFFLEGLSSSDDDIEFYINLNPDNEDTDDPGGGHRDSYAATESGDRFIATAAGFSPFTDVIDNLRIEATVNNVTFTTETIDYIHGYLGPSQTKCYSLLPSQAGQTCNSENDSEFVLDIPNTQTFDNDRYLFLMPTINRPSAVHLGYTLIGNPYNISFSHGNTSSNEPLTMEFKYDDLLPSNSAPQTLSILRLSQSDKRWTPVRDTLLRSSKIIEHVTHKPGIYSLAVGPVWCDSFFTSQGIAETQNIEIDGYSALYNPAYAILTDNSISGTITSIPITPPIDVKQWTTLQFSSTVPISTNIKVDIFDDQGDIILSNVQNNADLSDLFTSEYPTLKLRATLTSDDPGETPRLHDWCLSWERIYSVYIPAVFK